MLAEIKHEQDTGLSLSGRSPAPRSRLSDSPARDHRDEILGKVAHELRTPLSTILMTTAFVLEELLRPEASAPLRLHLETTKRAATLMGRLIDDLLEGATLASGRLALARTPLRVKDLFANAGTLLRPIAAAWHIELIFTEDENLPPISADEGRLIQVITNLVGNAIKFSESGGRIVVSARLEPHCISFSVADCGRGIAAADVTHVFDRFWQAPATRHSGVGLGLAIAREIVEAHGGGIGVTSTVGQGSVFAFTVPR